MLTVLRDGRELAVSLLAGGEDSLRVEAGRRERLRMDLAKAEQRSRPTWTPAPDHPWRRGFETGAVGMAASVTRAGTADVPSGHVQRMLAASPPQHRSRGPTRPLWRPRFGFRRPRAGQGRRASVARPRRSSRLRRHLRIGGRGHLWNCFDTEPHERCLVSER